MASSVSAFGRALRLLPGTIIANTANIFFDYNPPGDH